MNKEDHTLSSLPRRSIADSPEIARPGAYNDQSASPTPRSRNTTHPGSSSTSLTDTPYQSALASTSSLNLPHSTNPDDSFQSQDRQPGGEDLTPYVIQKPQMPQSSSTVVLRHSDELSDEDEDIQNLSFGLDPTPSSAGVSPLRRRASPHAPAAKEPSTADKAGVILGIHNVFVVLPQFVVTLMASIIFHIMEPGTGDGIAPKHPNAIPLPIPISDNINGTIAESVRLMAREGMVEGGSSDAVGLIFRLVAISIAVVFIVFMRLSADV